jgi:thiosulfate/3-mercaptopyruvate sulfurtransferase
MRYTTLITTFELANNLTNRDWVVVDSRFSLDDHERGERAYQAEHIPGAIYAHLERDLSGPIIAGKTGRHPLPDPDRFAATLSGWGIGPATQVVVYDDGNGSVAARLWWMLRWMGHDAVAVLDGGWAEWKREGRPTRLGVETREPGRFVAHPRPELVAPLEEVIALAGAADHRLIDARSSERYRGEVEPIDAKAGHIPGAVSGPFAGNLGSDGRFRSSAELRQRFVSLLGETPAEQTVVYCGSGVTAAHNLLALAHAGLGDARLYPGSWSEWITDPERPIATGDEPSTT